MNIIAFVAFGLDKRRAIRRRRRIAERQLLMLAALGGSIGAYLGRWRFHHKTRKRGFSLALHLIAASQSALMLWMFIDP